MFVPGHAGLQSSERADRLPVLATISDGWPLDHVIINNLKDIVSVENFGGVGIDIEAARAEDEDQYHKKWVVFQAHKNH